MENFVHFLEEQTHDKSIAQQPLIEDWNISHTTLEDVFLKVTKQEGFEYPPCRPLPFTKKRKKKKKKEKKEKRKKKERT
jgi:hypothetical protein